MSKTKVKKEKKERKKIDRTYPNLEEGKLTECPDDFNFKSHQVIGKKWWAEEHLYLFHSASVFEFKAQEQHRKAEDCKLLGNKKDRVKAKKLLNMQTNMAKLEAELRESGVDVDALMAD